MTTCRPGHVIDSLLILSNRVCEDEEGGAGEKNGAEETQWWEI